MLNYDFEITSNIIDTSVIPPNIQCTCTNLNKFYYKENQCIQATKTQYTVAFKESTVVDALDISSFPIKYKIQTGLV